MVDASVEYFKNKEEFAVVRYDGADASYWFEISGGVITRGNGWFSFQRDMWIKITEAEFRALITKWAIQ